MRKDSSLWLTLGAVAALSAVSEARRRSARGSAGEGSEDGSTPMARSNLLAARESAEIALEQVGRGAEVPAWAADRISRADQHLDDVAGYLRGRARFGSGARKGSSAFEAYHQTERETADKIMRQGFRLAPSRAASLDDEMPIGIFLKPDEDWIMIASDPAQILVQVNARRFARFRDRREFQTYMKSDPIYKNMKIEMERIEKDQEEKSKKIIDDIEKIQKKINEHRDELENWQIFSLSVQIQRKAEELNRMHSAFIDKMKEKIFEIRKEITRFIEAEGYEGVVVYTDHGSHGRVVTTTVVFDPSKVIPKRIE